MIDTNNEIARLSGERDTLNRRKAEIDAALLGSDCAELKLERRQVCGRLQDLDQMIAALRRSLKNANNSVHYEAAIFRKLKVLLAAELGALKAQQLINQAINELEGRTDD